MADNVSRKQLRAKLDRFIQENLDGVRLMAAWHDLYDNCPADSLDDCCLHAILQSETPDGR